MYSATENVQFHDLAIDGRSRQKLAVYSNTTSSIVKLYSDLYSYSQEMKAITWNATSVAVMSMFVLVCYPRSVRSVKSSA